MIETNGEDSVNPQSAEDLHKFWKGNQGKSGLTKREYFAANVTFYKDEVRFASGVAMEGFIGRKINLSNSGDVLLAVAQSEAKMRVMKADALIKALNQ
jgi:hypothetical protein